MACTMNLVTVGIYPLLTKETKNRGGVKATPQKRKKIKMKNIKLLQMLDKTFDSNLRATLKNSNNDACVENHENKITYRLKRMNDNLRIRMVDNRNDKDQIDEVKHEDAFYRVSYRETCYLSHQGQEAGSVFGCEFYTDLMFVGNKLISCSVVARFINNENHNEPHDSLRPSVDVHWKLNEDGKFNFDLGCSSFNNTNFHEIRKYQHALALVEKVVVPKMRSITAGIWNLPRITISDDID